jgi:glycine cleavage system H protein
MARNWVSLHYPASMVVPADLRYSPDHEWARRNGRTVTIGITEYAQDALGDIVFVQPPTVGLAVVSGMTLTEVESTKSVSDIYAPVSGTLTGFNTELENAPELINSDPYGKGWLCTIELTERSDELDQSATPRAMKVFSMPLLTKP